MSSRPATAPSSLVPVLDIGGTHVTSALVDPDRWVLAGPMTRLSVSPNGSAREILDTFLSAAAAVPAPAGAAWGVAMPDPFDYATGVARFRGVGKFDSLDGHDVRAALQAGISTGPGAIEFVNDADAFVLGEWLNGVASGSIRCAGITLGTGIGSGFVADGRIVDSGPTVPPGGRAHRLTVDGAPLEHAVSRRAIRQAYAAATGDERADVVEICARARNGDRLATRTLGRALRTLGKSLAPWITRFGAEVIVIGGSMAASWDVLESPFVDGFGAVAEPPKLAVAADAARAPLLGAARRARSLS